MPEDDPSNQNPTGERRLGSEELLPRVYEELRRLAAAKLAREGPGQTLQATALVHEAYMRLDAGGGALWDSPGHFFGAAALAMRRILVERARRVGRVRHGGDRERVPLTDVHAAETDDAVDYVALDEALRRMEKEDPRMAQIVMLRFFAGLSVEATAEAMGLSATTVKREWACARAWLYDELHDAGAADAPDG